MDVQQQIDEARKQFAQSLVGLWQSALGAPVVQLWEIRANGTGKYSINGPMGYVCAEKHFEWRQPDGGVFELRHLQHLSLEPPGELELSQEERAWQTIRYDFVMVCTDDIVEVAAFDVAKIGEPRGFLVRGAPIVYGGPIPEPRITEPAVMADVEQRCFVHGNGEIVTDDEPILRALCRYPTDETMRRVYADWLEDRGDPRSRYVRAELAWGTNRTAEAEAQLQQQANGLDAVWVARVSRPPIGVCCEHVQFERLNENERPRPCLSHADLDWLEARFKLQLPADYKAFLLNYNGGDPEPGHFRHDVVTQRFGISLPVGYHGSCFDWNEDGSKRGPMYGQVSLFTTVWAAADSVPDNAQASGDWSPDLVNDLQLLEHFRSGTAGWPAPYWREGIRANLIWIGFSAATGMHELWCLGVRGEQFGRVYHVASHSDHCCECDDCLLIAPSFAAFLGLLAPPASQARKH